MRRRSSEEKMQKMIDFDNKSSKMQRRLKEPRRKSRRLGRSVKQKQSLKVQRRPCQ